MKYTWAVLHRELEVSKMSKIGHFSLRQVLRLNFPNSDSEHMTCSMEAMDGVELVGCGEGMQAL